MSKQFRNSAAAAVAHASPQEIAATETSIRQMLAQGNSKGALEIAKDFHKAQRTAAAESLLLDVYAARVQALLDQNLTLEAKSLLDLVRQRFPAAKARLDGALRSVAAHSGDLDTLLKPLTEAGLSAERRADIEKVIQTELTDLAALANCAALPGEHPLRQAAGALDRAFEQVTSGPVTDEQIALGEVSFRSPLASWKFLIRAIASLYRGEDAACRECLAAVKPESVPARLVPALQYMLGTKTGGALKTTEAALISRIDLNLADLRAALKNVDDAFNQRQQTGKVLKAVRTAVRECRQTAPDLLPELKQVIMVRWAASLEDEDAMAEALEGAPVKNAEYLRMLALAMEADGDHDDLLDACELWDRFLTKALQEGWFSESSAEAGAVYVHMADLLEKSGPPDRNELEARYGKKLADEIYFWTPEKFYARACQADPHPEAFQAWMRFAEEEGDGDAEKVARQWHQQCPEALEPVLYLMEQAEEDEDFPGALALAEEAARIDPVHAKVRAARPRLLTCSIVTALEENKTLLAAQALQALEELPQARQGDRPALVAALRCLLREQTGDKSGMREAQLEAERLLGSTGGSLLLYGLATCIGRSGPLMLSLPLVKVLSKAERKSLPELLARVITLVRELGMDNFNFQVPEPYLKEAVTQFTKVKEQMDAAQLYAAGEMGLFLDRPKLAWMAAGEGLKRGGDLTARFLMLRARALPDQHPQRGLALNAAAAEFGRAQGDMALVDEAVEQVRNPFGGESAHMTLEQAREVVRRELKSPAFPTRNSRPPDYDDLLPMAKRLCDCAECRRKRGEDFDDEEELGTFEDDFFDPELVEEEVKRLFDEVAPKGMPPELKKQLMEAMKESLVTGEAPEKIMERIFGPPPGGKKKKR